MSTRRDPVRVVEQLGLGGGSSVLELHGLGGRMRMNVLRLCSADAARQAMASAQRWQGAEVIGGEVGQCPRCGTTGDVTALFGYRLDSGRRRRQSWCRVCRSIGRSTP